MGFGRFIVWNRCNYIENLHLSAVIGECRFFVCRKMESLNILLRGRL